MKKLLLLALILTSGCAQHQFTPGTFSGTFALEFEAPETFKYTPDTEDPMTFTRSTGERITPDFVMYTDGGSIPYLFRIFERVNPWYFGPAYVLHDYLFQIHQCFPAREVYGFDESGEIMGEALTTLMSETAEYGNLNRALVSVLFQAVTSPIAKMSWNGECVLPREVFAPMYYKEREF